jgi:hypothetical protein
MNNSTMQTKLASFAGAALLLIWSGNALKADSIVFSDPLELFPTGTISSAGGSSPLVGTDIQIRHVKGPDGIDHSVHHFGGLGTGTLSFETGDFVGMLGSDLVYGSSGPNDFIQIVGTVPDAGVVGSPPPLLLSGTLLGAIVDPQLGQIKLGLDLGAGFDTKNAQLLDFFGIPANTQFFFTTLLFTPVIDVQPDGSFSAKVLSTTVTNTIVPEPSSLALGITSLVLVMCFRKSGWARRGWRRQRIPL